MPSDPEDKTGNKACIRILFMVVPDCDMGADGTFVFADAGLEQNPDPEKLGKHCNFFRRFFQTSCQEKNRL